MQITAAVARQRQGAFSIEPVELTEPRADELLVKVTASGMCQTDQHGRDGYYNTPLPAVFGHEGAGVVQAVGPGVTKFKPGDHVVMSIPWCGVCPNPPRDEAHCQKSFDLKMSGTRADGSTLMSQQRLAGLQRVLPAIVVCHSRDRQRALCGQKFDSDAPLDLVGPLACSGQTGAGAVLNSLTPAWRAMPLRCSASARSGCRA